MQLRSELCAASLCAEQVRSFVLFFGNFSVDTGFGAFPLKHGGMQHIGQSQNPRQ